MRKEMLMDVAFEKFCHKGYNITLSEIAEGAGIKKQSVYNHFKDKDDLLYTVVETKLDLFYTTISTEFDGYINLEPEVALRNMFFSICDYYTDTEKIKFIRWILLIESKELFLRCREFIRDREQQFYSRVKIMLDKQFEGKVINENEIWNAVQTFVVMIHGVLDGMLLFQDIYDPKILIQNTWHFYWNGIEKLSSK